MSNNKSFLSLLAGLAAGAAIGMLYAPDKGWKTRARVRRAAANGFDDLKESLDGLGGKAEEKADEAKQSIKTLKETLLQKGAEIKEGTRAILLDQLSHIEEALRKAEESDARAEYHEDYQEDE
ncbi:MAG: YtxH domain-containing protein [Bacteroidales bacterium]|nr:YtxH domain-containing protein [Bacteroidales bacterium]